MLTDDEIAFLRAALDEDEEIAERARRNGYPVNSGPVNGWWVRRSHASPSGTVAEPITRAAGTHAARHEPERVLREVAVWRRLLLDYSIPPGTDAKYGGTERETGYRLALSAALKAKIATYEGNPVTGEPFSSRQERG
jgi:Family of unknown function (DUF6221)